MGSSCPRSVPELPHPLRMSWKTFQLKCQNSSVSKRQGSKYSLVKLSDALFRERSLPSQLLSGSLGAWSYLPLLEMIFFFLSSLEHYAFNFTCIKLSFSSHHFLIPNVIYLPFYSFFLHRLVQISLFVGEGCVIFFFHFPAFPGLINFSLFWFSLK